MSRKMEEDILKAIGMEAVWENEIWEQVSDSFIGYNNAPWSKPQEEDFTESIQSLKDKNHVNYHDYTTGQERKLFSLSKSGVSRYVRIMKREGLI